MPRAEDYMRRSVAQFYMARRVPGAYAEDCMRDSWYQLICACAAADGVDVSPAPPGWWTEELERIFTATRGTVITDDMKRAAGIALQVARGQRWDDEKQEWTAGVEGRTK